MIFAARLTPRTEWMRMLPIGLTVAALAIFDGHLVASGPDRQSLVVAALVNGILLVPILAGRVFPLLAVFVALIPIGSFGQAFDTATVTVLPFLGLAIGGLWLTNVMVGRMRLRRFPEAKYLALLMALVLLSAVANADRLQGYLPLFTHLQLVVLTFVVVQVVQDERQVRRLAWLILVSLTASSLVTVMSSFGIATAVNQEIETEVTRGVEVLRFGSASGGINWASAELLVGIVLAFNLLFLERSLSRRLVLLICIVMMGFANVLTYSLGGWAALLVALGLSLRPAGRIGLRGIATTLAVAIVGALMITQLVPGFQSRIQNKADQIRSQPVSYWLSMRVGANIAGAKLLARNPVLGVGPGNSKWFLPEFLSIPFANQVGAHSTYLELGDELGAPALVLFAIVLLSALRRPGTVRPHTHRDPSSWRLRRAIQTSLAGLAMLSFVEGLERFKYLWLLIGLAIALDLRGDTEETEDPLPPSAGSVPGSGPSPTPGSRAWRPRLPGTGRS